MEKKFSIAPLPGGFMLTAIVGLLFSMLWVYPLNKSWGIGFTLIFGIMFISALISMTYGPTEIELEYYKRVLEKGKKKATRRKKKKR